MNKKILITLVCLLLFLALVILGVKYAVEKAVEAAVQEYIAEQMPPTESTVETTQAPPETAAPTTEETEPPDVYSFTQEEQLLLLKLGMAERGDSGCVECVALVMRTVLNRVEGPKFSSTIRGVVYAQDQFTPVADGTFEAAQPNQLCYDALEMIEKGWDESQGALYYEWCEGESWHSQNLNLLCQHCDMRLYN